MMQITYVYVFGPLGRPCKIGFSVLPKNRAATMRHEHAKFIPRSVVDRSIMWHLEELNSAYEAAIVERKAHEILDEYRIVDPKHPGYRKRCEWFDVDPKQAVAAVQKAMKLTAMEVTFSEDGYAFLNSLMSKSCCYSKVLARLVKEQRNVKLKAVAASS